MAKNPNFFLTNLFLKIYFFLVFKILELDDRITLVQDCIYSLGVLNFSRIFNAETKEYTFFGYNKTEEKTILEFFPELKTIQEDLLYVGDLIKTVAFDEVELTCLTGLLVFNPGEMEISCWSGIAYKSLVFSSWSYLSIFFFQCLQMLII